MIVGSVNGAEAKQLIERLGAMKIGSGIDIEVDDDKEAHFFAKMHPELNIHFHDDVALTVAVMCSKLDIVKILVETGANVRASNDLALRSSVIQGDRELELTKYLLESGADVHALNESCLLLACYRGDSHRTQSDFSINEGRNQYSKRIMGEPGVFDKRASSSYINTIVTLLKYGADLNTGNSIPLFYTVSRGHYFSTLVLLEYGAKADARDGAILAEARRSGKKDIEQLLLKYTT
ncbi:putative ankyrin repeat protein L25 [Zancudomyces culisetae]|uniref:Putative ankyrin repeat protein L25 n=1 Tax=Zancudomyces culisetae TaxID=1213189 RepID=A0A1R1PRP6_ZANCU|nr:putative ankyrin repeat protein L25 [Zancudomyces culisetae]|eukprot:OMH83655.1 putative ankyrin repeat protein L25 [Zancudomyces culisetae]